MGRLNWSGFDGAEFESLVHSLLFFEVPDILLFGRPGKDSGQDAITRDRTHVYQAKYGRTLTCDEAITRAKDELDKIREYLREDNSNYRFWSTVTHWTLVANFETNTWDVCKWQKEIIEKYADLHFELDFWGLAELEALLVRYPDVEQAYFIGKNRSFIGLWEARCFLERGILGKYFFSTSLHGRDEHLKTIDAFTLDEHLRFLFVHGQAGSGKSRFLYESAVRLSENGWRVFWGLSNSMSLSDAWMSGVTGANDKTCIVVDSPQNATLVNAIYEQLSTMDKKTWKAIVSCQEYDFRNRYETMVLRNDTTEITLEPLTETATKETVNDFAAKTGFELPDRGKQGLFELTRGVPGWIVSVLGYSCENGKSLHLYPELLKVISEQLRTALREWDEVTRERRLFVLRWVCVWKTIVIEEDGTGGMNPKMMFLEKELASKPEQICNDIQSLVEKGLLTRWGRNRRIISAEPTLVRQHVLSEWLLEDDGDSYRATSAGRDFVRRLLKTEIPDKEAIVDNLAELSACYLRKETQMDFFQPVVDELKAEAESDDVVQQLAVFDWAKRIMAMDPEAALEIVIRLWDNPAPPKIVKHQYWGDEKIEHERLVSDIASFLYSISDLCRTRAVCKIVWNGFRRIYSEEMAGRFKAYNGQKTEELVLRLLRRINRMDLFRQLAYDELVRNCEKNQFGQFDMLVAKGLLSCRHESVESSRRLVTFSHRYISPGTPDWERAAKVRSLMFTLVADNKFPDCSAAIWSLLAEAHGDWRASDMLDEKSAQDLAPYYDPIVINDLRKTLEILKKRKNDITSLELAAARQFWERALKNAASEEERALAEACEREYSSHFTFDFNSFFSWTLDEDASSVMLDKIKCLFRTAQSPKVIVAFFDEAAEFLQSQKSGTQESDCGRGSDLANACWDMYSPTDHNAFSEFVETTLKMPHGQNQFMDSFCACFLRRWINELKSHDDGNGVVNEIRRLVGNSKGKELLLTGVYEGVSSKLIGRITSQELAFVCSSECNFSNRKLSCILPTFLAADQEKVLQRFGAILDSERMTPVELDRDWWAFMVYCHLIILREDDGTVPNPIKWLMNSFSEYEINGAYLGSYELMHLAKQAGFHFSQKEFVSLMQRRNGLEGKKKPFPEYEVMPHKFDVATWVSEEMDACAIHDLCRLALNEKTYLSIRRLPQYLAALDKNGLFVGSFVKDYLATVCAPDSCDLEGLGSLASCYEERSDAWRNVVEPICRYMNEEGIAQSDRYVAYLSFQPKFHSWSSALGEVPALFIDREVATRKALEETAPDSDLREYYEWAHNLADWDLKSAQERAEEERHG